MTCLRGVGWPMLNSTDLGKFDFQTICDFAINLFYLNLNTFLCMLCIYGTYRHITYG